ncbi:GntR family transcriptional regulator [Streptacidiphilus sp. P02-A3a]|uniref:GntR family transcriptional regulator n=1 Tax=Streptacidiphilus sp. P02-A3a TaxID=2704468 RepID=UPI0015F91F22|nr:UTRA domain-containing protein [Streptacidiphilus sp. P02-A3a]QMU72480.1 UTRA domain-containing protein [Streptacidiphilus sp. P02-A3a]
MGDSEWVHTSAPYVRPRQQGQRDAWSEETAAQGHRGTQHIVHAREIPAPAEVAALLGATEGVGIVERRRIIYLEGNATELTDTYYPADIARETPLAGTARIRGGAVTLLAGLGHTGHRVREEISARMPSPAEQESLGLGDHEPVLQLTRVTLDSEEQPFQVDVSVFPANTQRLRYEMRID